jgi:hypothetical protein
MAWFEGIPPVTGSIGTVCIYKMHGRYFMRSRRSLTGERVKKDAAFRKTMEYATLLAKASRIGSAVYAGLLAHQKQNALYRKFTGKAMTWLKYGWKEKEVLEWLQQLYTPQVINIFFQHLEEQRLAVKASKREEQAITGFTIRMNRRLVSALRQGDYSILDDRPYAKRFKRSFENPSTRSG